MNYKKKILIRLRKNIFWLLMLWKENNINDYKFIRCWLFFCLWYIILYYMFLLFWIIFIKGCVLFFVYGVSGIINGYVFFVIVVVVILVGVCYGGFYRG